MTSARRTPGSRSPGDRGRPAARSRRSAARRTTAGAASGGDAPASSRPRLTGRAAVLFLVLGLLLVAYAWPAREYVRQRSDIAALRAEEAAAQTRVDALAATKERWQDPAYVEAQARQRLHFVRPGETAYVVLRPEQPTATAPTETAQAAAPPWFDALWETVRAADAAGADPTGGRG